LAVEVSDLFSPRSRVIALTTAQPRYQQSVKRDLEIDLLRRKRDLLTPKRCPAFTPPLMSMC
jgi:hypothetical protein